MGKEEIKVQLIDMAYLYRKDKEVLLRTHDGQGFVFWQSLDEIEKKLDPAHFCRVNRSYIITRKSFKRLQKQSDRGIHLELEPQTELPVKISRDKAAMVISWLKAQLVIKNR
ncbi:LytTR family DNA-binding domain-containing protein [Mucilaginibacter sp. McL0603]|uniref:LytTR family DNA-binding domain-containing protein n=1 Tax=Mucilaginibacter sp. McL0603 TaxID=3415670 RepID=UPI003CF6DB69